MNRRNRVAALPVAAVASALVLAACSGGSATDPTASATGGSGSAEQVSIRAAWWGADSRNNATIAALDLYTAENPHVTINSEYAPFAGHFDKLATLTASGDMPDLVQFQYTFFPTYVENEQLLELDQFSPDVLDLSSLDEGVLQQGVVDGGRFAIPAGANTQAIIYDPEIFEAAGVDVPDRDWTWDDYAATLEALVESGEIQFGSNDFSGSDQLFDFWLTQRGKAFYGPDGTLGFEAGDLEEFWNFFGDLRDRGLVPPADITSATTGDVATYPIVTGIAAMDFAFSTVLPGIVSTAGRDLALLPYPSGGSAPGQYLIGTGITWAGAATTDHPEVVADIINFLTNDPDALAVQGLERGVPVSAAGREVISTDLGETQQHMVDFVDQTANGPLAPESRFYNAPPSGANEVTGLFLTAAQSFAFGQTGAADAAKTLVTEAQDALSRAAG